MDAPKTAIIAGGGLLPGVLADRLARTPGRGYVVLTLRGAGARLDPRHQPQECEVERLVPLFNHLHDCGVGDVVLAGAVTRTRLDPERIDPQTATLLPRILPALQQGDDATLRAILALFEEEGFRMRAAQDIAPDLLPDPGVLGAVQPGDQDRRDAARGHEILSLLAPADLGQGTVVAQGLCLAVETLPGTDAMLRFVQTVAGALRPDPDGAAGVFCKAPKAGQDRRVDLPVIGPDTVRAAAAAGLAGISIAQGGVMILDRAATIAAADQAGLFLSVEPV